uniref:Pirin domain protein domain protein n=1 Tax=Solibacter usitatus (strain Ellin6076) TaxID=234267 RepID=Q01ZF3_SOLUE
MITIRKSDERGHANHGWLNTFHTFSFASYYDPKHMGFGPLRVINEDRVSPGRGFGSHGHEDMEILTYVISGALAHKDSMGNVETLQANDLQRITAGTGIVHSEFNGSAKDPVHFLQIWIQPAEYNLTPGYEQLSLTETEKSGKLRLVASPEGGNGALKINQDARVLIGQAGEAEALEYALPAGRKAWVHVIRGSASVNDQLLLAGDAAAITDESSIAIRGDDPGAEVLLFDLK